MNVLSTVSFLLALFAVVSLAGLWWLQQGVRSSQSRALEIMLGQRARTADRLPAKQSVKNALLGPVRLIKPLLGKGTDPQLTARLEKAALPVETARDAYLAARVLGPIMAVVACSFLSSNRFQFMLISGVVLYYAPDVVLRRLVKRRVERIRLGIPDIIDLLVVCVDAGLGLDQAMQRTGNELRVSHPDMCDELLQISREQRAGKPRLDAWSGFAKRIELPEIDGFVEMLMQTDRFGTPIARALSAYGDMIREKRRQRAEEMAAKTSVKIVFPLVLCIFPSLFIVLLGPAMITITRGFSFAGK